MSSKKWGESFLKSGLPLEHVAALAVRSQGWWVQSNIEYQRELGNTQARSFELDLLAMTPTQNNGSALSILAECKYHDMSRFWMFLPSDSPPHAVNESRLLNFSPIQTLRQLVGRTFSGLAPFSSVGVVLSHDGQKQRNAIHIGMQQLANAFVPYWLPQTLQSLDAFAISTPTDEESLAHAIIPTLITNAALFRLRPEITDLSTIRDAGRPGDVADPIPWTWCRFNASNALRASNERLFHQLLSHEREKFARFPAAEMRIRHLLNAPSWIAVVNIESFSEFAETLQERFMKLDLRNAYELIAASDTSKPLETERS